MRTRKDFERQYSGILISSELTRRVSSEIFLAAIMGVYHPIFLMSFSGKSSSSISMEMISRLLMGLRYGTISMFVTWFLVTFLPMSGPKKNQNEPGMYGISVRGRGHRCVSSSRRPKRSSKKQSQSKSSRGEISISLRLLVIQKKQKLNWGGRRK